MPTGIQPRGQSAEVNARQMVVDPADSLREKAAIYVERGVAHGTARGGFIAVPPTVPRAQTLARSRAHPDVRSMIS